MCVCHECIKLQQNLFIYLFVLNVFVTFQVHWLKTDFEKWRDEDDSDVDESKDAAFEDVRTCCSTI